MKSEKRELTAAQKHARTKGIIIGAFLGSILLVVLCSVFPGMLGDGGEERETLPPIDPSKLHETKEEDFDILEYEEYLKYDRAVYYVDKMTGVTESVDDESADTHGEGLKLLYKLFGAVINGDANAYNSMVAESLQYPDGFTQQQVYDITVTKQSQNTEAGHTEYIFKVEYKIHENNGSFRNTVESDASRPQYFVINDSSGRLLVEDIIDIIYK
jgi:hypothetical protein